MGVLVGFLVVLGFSTWLVVKLLKGLFLLGRYNNRNGIKAGIHSEKASNPKQLIALYKNAKQWDAELKSKYRTEQYKNF